MKEHKFFICKHCGNMIEMVKDSGVPLVCCGEKMTELVPNTSDGASEKHVPGIHADEKMVTIKIGAVDHPMIDAHFIEWISILTEKGIQRKYLKPGDKPEVVFALERDRLVAAYAYCNLHGLWKADF